MKEYQMYHNTVYESLKQNPLIMIFVKHIKIVMI